MPLNDAQRKHLRRLGHDRDPIVMIGQNGLSPTVVTEMDRALGDHELVKVRARVGDRDERDRLLAALAAAYGYGLVTSHPFSDGNKRVGFLAMYVFLDLNGLELEAEEPEVVDLMVAVAAGRMKEETLAEWLRRHLRPISG